MSPPDNSEITFLKEIGLHWPSWDVKTKQNYIYILKYLCDMDFAITAAKQKNVCIQAGGHVGLWPIRLSQHFEKVITFEAEPSVATCLFQNTQSFPNISCDWAALSDKVGHLFIQRSGSSGSSRIKPDGAQVKCLPIDSLQLAACDAIFLDVEHHELQVLNGAINTIDSFSPVIQVEELDSSDGVQAFLENLRYKKVLKESKDAVYIRA